MADFFTLLLQFSRRPAYDTMKAFTYFLHTAENIVALLSDRRPSPGHVRQILTQIIHQNLFYDTTVAVHFINTCSSLGLLQLALPVFTNLTRPHVFTCNNMIRAFSHSHIPSIPLQIYIHMFGSSVRPNNFTFPFLLKSLADFQELNQGRCIHAHVVKLGHFDDIYVGNSLMSVYSGDMRLCRKVFDEMPLRDVVSWTALITGYRNIRRLDDALLAFEQMQYAGVEPNRVTLVNALAACASFGAVDMGVWIHDLIRRKGLELDVILGTSLIDMYAKCGRINEGIDVFRSMETKNAFTWNAVIQGLALAKTGDEAVSWFIRMEHEGFKVDEVTLVAVLGACSHSGLVDKGKEIFGSLILGKYGFSASVKHYACMVDLLSRAGHLEDAISLIKEMPFEPTKAMWGAILAGSRDRENLELSEFAVRKLLELEPDSGAYYAMLANIYAEMGKWNEVEEVRGLMKENGLTKDLGYSSVESELIG